MTSSPGELTVIMIGSFDTKGSEYEYLYECLNANGLSICAIDTSIHKSEVSFPIHYSPKELLASINIDLEKLRSEGDRSNALDSIAEAAKILLADLVAQSQYAGIIGMGGGGGTYVFLKAIQDLPLEFPKLCISTVATKDLSRQVGSQDVLLMPSIVDIAGLNKISRLIIRKAAGALNGMARMIQTSDDESKKTIAISMFGNTTQCVEFCRQMLEKQGFEILCFHAVGSGGRTMEQLIKRGKIDAVLDITTTELADEICEGICTAGPTRLEAASEMGIPQVVVPGCLDMVNYGHIDTVPPRFKNRLLYSWSPDVTLMRTNLQENSTLGKMIAQKLNKSTGKVSILIPLQGISLLSREGGVFYEPEADYALFEAIKTSVNDEIVLYELPYHINEEEFANKAVQELLKIL